MNFLRRIILQVIKCIDELNADPKIHGIRRIHIGKNSADFQILLYAQQLLLTTNKNVVIFTKDHYAECIENSNRYLYTNDVNFISVYFQSISEGNNLIDCQINEDSDLEIDLQDSDLEIDLQGSDSEISIKSNNQGDEFESLESSKELQLTYKPIVNNIPIVKNYDLRNICKVK